MLRKMNKEDRQKAEGLIAEIMAFKNDDFPKEELEDLSINMLERVKSFLEKRDDELKANAEKIDDLEKEIVDLKEPKDPPKPDEVEAANRVYISALREELPLDV